MIGGLGTQGWYMPPPPDHLYLSISFLTMHKFGVAVHVR